MRTMYGSGARAAKAAATAAAAGSSSAASCATDGITVIAGKRSAKRWGVHKLQARREKCWRRAAVTNG